MLSGAAGYSYGANGIWQVDRSDRPYGASPHGTSWGGRPWDEAAALPGAAQVGAGKRVLERFPWWRCEPHPEWAEPHQHAGNRHLAYAAGIPGELRILYLPCELSDPVIVCGLEAGLAYAARTGAPGDGVGRYRSRTSTPAIAISPTRPASPGSCASSTCRAS